MSPRSKYGQSWLGVAIVGALCRECRFRTAICVVPTRRLAMPAIGPVTHRTGRSMMVAAHLRIELREHPVRVVAIYPDVPIEVRLEHMGFVNRGPRVIEHMVVGDTLIAGSLLVARRAPCLLEHKIFHRDEFKAAIRLRLVDEN